MQHIVTANDRRLGIGQQREGVTEFLRLPPVNLRWVDANPDDADATRVEF